jgi:tRNA pseudouridine55 synthase
MSVHGWIIVDKPLGISSAGVVGRIKGLARRAGWGKCKVGHGGTLDPLATGVLPIALGEATKLSGRLLGAVKAYRFEVTFGSATATDDAEGAVVASSDVRPTGAEVEAVLARFTGPISQRPPAYSALKVDGERAYARARAGEDVVLAEREVTIHFLALTPIPTLKGEALQSVTLDVVCSKGTYVRSLARDIALAVGTVGHVTILCRTRAGPFAEAQSHTLDSLQALCDTHHLADAVLPIAAGLDDIPALVVDPDEAAALKQGRRLAGRPGRSGLHLATLGDMPVALVAVSSDEVRVERGFNL